jgi:hypothetical protein
MAKRAFRMVVAASGLFLACDRTPPPSPFKPIADNKLLMQAVLDPHANVIWGSVGTIITSEGIRQRRPETEEQWTAVRNSAVTLGESGNLLMIGTRALDDGEWAAGARMLVEASLKTIEAAEARDGDALFQAGSDLYAACTNCHEKYVPEIRDANK